MPNVHLGPHFDRFVQEQVEVGRFQNLSEVVRAALSMLEDAEVSAAERRAAIRAELAARAQDGHPMQPAAEVFAVLRSRLKAELLGD